MEFTNNFSVPASLPLVWELLISAQEVAPCVPGAQITDQIDERRYKGTVKIKLGAVQMTYRGELEMEPDENSHVITLRAKGTEARGSGGVSGTVTTTLAESGNGMTNVSIHSRIDVTGRVAQFGRGIMQDVANRLIKDFAACLEQKIQDRSGSAAAATRGEQQPTEQPPRARAASRTKSRAAAGAEAVQVTAEPAGPVPADSTGIESGRAASSTGPAPAAKAARAPAELKVQSLILSVLRSRTAAGLRKLASLIEPK